MFRPVEGWVSGSSFGGCGRGEVGEVVRTRSLKESLLCSRL